MDRRGGRLASALEIPADLTRPPADTTPSARTTGPGSRSRNRDGPDPFQDKNWAGNDVDRFFLSSLEAKNLKPVADADKVTLLPAGHVRPDRAARRRPLRSTAFLADESPKAFEQVVDRLLAVPRVRRALGPALARRRPLRRVDRLRPATCRTRTPGSYRDYVIDAFNADKPFDQFVREQIAGRPPAAADSTTERNRAPDRDRVPRRSASRT